MELHFEPGVAIHHFTYVDSEQFIRKLNRYTSIEAKQAFERGERAGSPTALWKGVREFAGRYLKGRGFQDGWRGFYISLFYTFYRIATVAKLHELTAVGNSERIEAQYRKEAENILKDYVEVQSTVVS